jgi:phenylacetate-CoA ligase
MTAQEQPPSANGPSDRPVSFWQAALHGAWRCLPSRWRFGSRFVEFERLARDCEEWSSDEIAAYQIKQVRQVLHHAFATCPFYQTRFTRARFRPEYVQHLHDLQSCPLLARTDLQEHYSDLASDLVPSASRLYTKTAGSSGTPLSFQLDRGLDAPKQFAFLAILWRRAGYQPGDRLATVFGSSSAADDSARDRSFRRFDPRENRLTLLIEGRETNQIERCLEELERFQPRFIEVSPATALDLARFLDCSSQAWRAPLRGMLCGSDRLSRPQKQILERVFQCRVYTWYNQAEHVVLAGEGRLSDLLYFSPVYGLAEFGDPDSNGLREIIATSFHHRAMPLIRYRTGDHVRLAGVTDPDNLEFPWPAAMDVTAPDREALVTTDGQRMPITSLDLHQPAFNHLYGLQFAQTQPGTAELLYVPAPGFQSSQLDAIRIACEKVLGSDFQIVPREVADLEPHAHGKRPWVLAS